MTSDSTILRDKIILLIRHYESELIEAETLIRFLSDEKILNRFGSSLQKVENVLSLAKYLTFVTISFLDIASSLNALLDPKTNWERKFHSKNACVSIYETIKTFHVNHKQITRLLLLEFPELEKRYSILALKLRQYKKEKKYGGELATLRNKAGAHYNQEVLVYLESLSLVNQLGTRKSIKEFGDILDELIQILADLVNEIHTRLTLNA